MTKIEELEQKIETINIVLENLKLELENYEKALAELKESKKEGKWKPTYNEMYVYRADFGGIRSCYWSDSEIDEWRYNNIPIFKTTDECERYYRFMDTVKEKCYEFSKEEWGNSDICKHTIEYVGNKKSFETGWARVLNPFGAIYFKTTEDAQYIIDNFKDELMEYFV